MSVLNTGVNCHTAFWKLEINYKITKIVRALWLAERRVCMRVRKHGCDIKMFCFSRLSRKHEFEKGFELKNLDKFTLFTHFLVGWNLENL